MPNKLTLETSPYLLQHADNPVEWYPWGEEALSFAKQFDKPILLSIGYSACHWCHVMAQESFADPATAALMNELFVNIKVDREERPDLDQIYQTAHALLTQRSGGWPLTMFLTPTQEPIFGGTYFPKQARYGLPGFTELLQRVADAYRQNNASIEQQKQRWREVFTANKPAPPTHTVLESASFDHMLNQLRTNFDPIDGGFGDAPKFPHAIELNFCLRRLVIQAEKPHIVTHSLSKMAEGGLFDQLGGGFYRYSVDRQWTIPHFEKMLYDNALLLSVMSDAYLATGLPRLAETIRSSAQWALREMQSPAGGYYSSIDADSEHQEGKFYLWTTTEIQNLLSKDEYALFGPHYGLDHPPNYEEHAWHLRISTPFSQLTQRLQLPPDHAQAVLNRAKEKLLSVRSQRIHPGRDEKILTSWNALMITGMTRAARVFAEKAWCQSAQLALDFIQHTLWNGERLNATYKDGRARLNAYLDDYAFLLQALLEMMQTEFRASDLNFARTLADALLNYFEDTSDGGCYFTSHDHEQLLDRPKTGHDNATPSGNGIAAQTLFVLGHLLGEQRYLSVAERIVRLFYPHFERHGFCSLLVALEFYLQPPTIVILRGPQTACNEWHTTLAKTYRPHSIIINVGEHRALPPALHKPLTAAPQAWVCRGTHCLIPIDDLTLLQDEIKLLV